MFDLKLFYFSDRLALYLHPIFWTITNRQIRSLELKKLKKK